MAADEGKADATNAASDAEVAAWLAASNSGVLRETFLRVDIGTLRMLDKEDLGKMCADIVVNGAPLGIGGRGIGFALHRLLNGELLLLGSGAALSVACQEQLVQRARVSWL